MLPNVVPLRAIVFQALFLLVAIAIEAVVLQRFLRLDPRQSVQYAASVNLLCTVVGWLALFIFFSLVYTMPADWTIPFQANLVNFIFFDQWSNETATSLILVCFVMFFASFAIKQSGLTALQWLLTAGTQKGAKKPEKQEDSTETEEAMKASERPARSKAIRVTRHQTQETRSGSRSLQPQARAVLFANASSFSAILAILILRLVF